MKLRFKEIKNNSKKNITKSSGLFGWLEASLRLDRIFQHGIPIRYMPHILFVTLLIIFYIGNNHYSERTLREINQLKNEVEELRADYTTLKADYMYLTKQSEIAKRAQILQLEESKLPPFKLKKLD